MKRRDVSPTDRQALVRAAQIERAARHAWNASLAGLARAITQASRHGASLRSIATIIGRSHGRVRELLHRENGDRGGS